MALTDYPSQVSFAKRWLRLGAIQRSGTWAHGRAWGHLWGGLVCGFYVQFETIGDGPLMRPGSFHVSARPRIAQKEPQK